MRSSMLRSFHSSGRSKGLSLLVTNVIRRGSGRLGLELDLIPELTTRGGDRSKVDGRGEPGNLADPLVFLGGVGKPLVPQAEDILHPDPGGAEQLGIWRLADRERAKTARRRADEGLVEEATQGRSVELLAQTWIPIQPSAEVKQSPERSRVVSQSRSISRVTPPWNA